MVQNFIKNVANNMKIYCCGCDKNVNSDLVIHNDEFFWECPNCRQSVGVHKVRDNEYAPLGAIPTKKIRKLQKKLDEEIKFILEQKKDVTDAKKKLYEWLSKKLFYQYRTESIISKKQYDYVLGHLNFLKSKLTEK